MFLQQIKIEDGRPPEKDTGASFSPRTSSHSRDRRPYTLWVGEDVVTRQLQEALGIHSFQIGEDGRDTEDFENLFAWDSEQYAAEIAIENLGSRGLFLTQRGFNKIIAHLEAIMIHADKDADDLYTIVQWRLNKGKGIFIFLFIPDYSSSNEDGRGKNRSLRGRIDGDPESYFPS